MVMSSDWVVHLLAITLEIVLVISLVLFSI